MVCESSSSGRCAATLDCSSARLSRGVIQRQIDSVSSTPSFHSVASIVMHENLHTDKSMLASA